MAQHMVIQPAPEQVPPARRLIAAGSKRGTGPLTPIVDRHEAAARIVAEFAGLTAADLRDSQLDAIGRARTTLADTRIELAQSGHLHLIDTTVPVPSIDRRVLRLRTQMRAAGYNPDRTNQVAALACVAVIDTDRLIAILTGRALLDRISQRRLAATLGVQPSAA